MNNKDIQLSKSLSWLLRHGAVREGFRLSPDGYLDVNKILHHKTFKDKYSTSDIERVVNYNDKQRFKLRRNPSSNCLQIKANQGHTITEVSDADLTPITEPKYNTVIHGTYLKCWPQIKHEGISCMKRKHIHFAKGTLEDASVISGLRQDTEVHIYIDFAGALADAVKFYESENGVILTSGNGKGYLEPKYFAKAVNICTDLFEEYAQRMTFSDEEPEGDCARNISKKQPIVMSNENGTQTENYKNNHEHCNKLFGQLVASEMNHINGQDRYELMTEIINLIRKKQVGK